MALKTSTKLDYYNQAGLNLTKTILHEGKNCCEASFKHSKLQPSDKTTKGKGVYGGANLARRPHPTERSSASLPARSWPPLSVVLLTIITFLELVSFI